MIITYYLNTLKNTFAGFSEHSIRIFTYDPYYEPTIMVCDVVSCTTYIISTDLKPGTKQQSSLERPVVKKRASQEKVQTVSCLKWMYC